MKISRGLEKILEGFTLGIMLRSREKLRFLMLHYLGDVNVQALLMAALLLEENFKVKGDPVGLVADELIDVAEYIGRKACTMTRHIERTTTPFGRCDWLVYS